MIGEKRAVACIVEYNGGILIGKKKSREGHAMSGEWHIPGEKLLDGEDWEDAVHRCISDEAGIRVIINEHIADYVNGYKFRVRWYLCTGSSPHPVAGEDLDDVKYVPRDQVREKCGPHDISTWPPEIRKYFDL